MPRQAAIRAVLPTIHRRMRPVLPAFLVAALLSGCESYVGGSLVYMTPYGIEKMTCEELSGKIAAADRAAKAKQNLIDRASGSTAGPVIGTVVYGPDYSKARWEQRRYEEEAERKNCDRPPISLLPPPAAAAPSQAMPPAPPTTNSYGLPTLGGRQ
jgi:hypothetical protein